MQTLLLYIINWTKRERRFKVIMGKDTIVKSAIGELTKLCSQKEIQKMIFGTYSDGKPRSLMDAINGEILSPKQKRNKLYKKRKSGKKKIRL